MRYGFEYCIYTQDNGSLAEIVGRYFESFTLVPSIGFWRGRPSNDACLTIVSNGPCPERIDHLIEEILVRNRAASVVLTVLLLHEIVYSVRSVERTEALGGRVMGVSAVTIPGTKEAQQTEASNLT
jgi:hypothetical protein